MMAKVDEKLMFKVIEFNKSAKKIIVSHSRVYEDEKKAAEAPVKKAEPESPKKTVRKQKSSSEKTTLGDISQLAALKEEMEEKENKASRKSKN
jgi:small subunit ribosomal protein S1